MTGSQKGLASLTGGILQKFIFLSFFYIDSYIMAEESYARFTIKINEQGLQTLNYLLAFDAIHDFCDSTRIRNKGHRQRNLNIINQIYDYNDDILNPYVSKIIGKKQKEMEQDVQEHLKKNYDIYILDMDKQKKLFNGAHASDSQTLMLNIISFFKFINKKQIYNHPCCNNLHRHRGDHCKAYFNKFEGNIEVECIPKLLNNKTVEDRNFYVYVDSAHSSITQCAVSSLTEHYNVKTIEDLPHIWDSATGSTVEKIIGQSEARYDEKQFTITDESHKVKYDIHYKLSDDKDVLLCVKKWNGKEYNFTDRVKNHLRDKVKHDKYVVINGYIYMKKVSLGDCNQIIKDINSRHKELRQYFIILKTCGDFGQILSALSLDEPDIIFYTQDKMCSLILAFLQSFLPNSTLINIMEDQKKKENYCVFNIPYNLQDVFFRDILPEWSVTNGEFIKQTEDKEEEEKDEEEEDEEEDEEEKDEKEEEDEEEDEEEKDEKEKYIDDIKKYYDEVENIVEQQFFSKEKYNWVTQFESEWISVPGVEDMTFVEIMWPFSKFKKGEPDTFPKIKNNNNFAFPRRLHAIKARRNFIDEMNAQAAASPHKGTPKKRRRV